jgi:hypothetical protein
MDAGWSVSWLRPKLLLPRARRSDRNRSPLSHSTSVIGVPALHEPEDSRLIHRKADEAVRGDAERVTRSRSGFTRALLPPADVPHRPIPEGLWQTRAAHGLGQTKSYGGERR